jgi:hypothetical protein
MVFRNGIVSDLDFVGSAFGEYEYGPRQDETTIFLQYKRKQYWL